MGNFYPIRSSNMCDFFPPKQSFLHIHSPAMLQKMSLAPSPKHCPLSQALPMDLLQNHRITECQGLEGTSVGHPVQPSHRSRVTYSRLQRTLSRWVQNISREGDSTTSLGSLCQCSVTLKVKKFFLMFRQNFRCFSLCPLPLVLSQGTSEESLAPSSWHPPLRE